jgi:hypothetical protein
MKGGGLRQQNWIKMIALKGFVASFAPIFSEQVNKFWLSP